MSNKKWLYFAITTTVLWGVWGAFIEIPEKAGFPATLGFSVWVLTLIPVAFVALKLINWNLDRNRSAIVLGMLAGLFGCGGQLILFQVLRIGPAYIVFPIVSLYPVVTIILSVLLLKERADRRSWIGIVLALCAIVLLSYQPPDSTAVSGVLWLLGATIVFLLWGVQAYIMKYGNNHGIKPESYTVYTMLSGMILIPAALWMTDFSAPINWGGSGLYSAILVQALNAVGFLFFAYTIRYGKAMIVVPLMALAPVVTVIISLILYMVIPHPIILTGMLVAFIAIYLMAE